MKAFVKKSETAEAITLVDAPKPQPGDHQLLVKIQAIGVGVHDEYFLPAQMSYPYVVGIEAAGIIESVGSDVTSYQVGQRIAFVSAMQAKGGTWAEYAVVDETSLIIPMPGGVSYQQAAALPVAGNTAFKALYASDVKSGEVLFIAGGAGAIGTLLIQIAKQRGCTVVASASPGNHAYMIELGADNVVDYHDTDWQQQVRDLYPDGVDAAIGIHPGTPADCEAIVRGDGVIVAVSGDNYTPARGIKLRQIPYAVDVTDELVELMQQIADGSVQHPIAKVYAFADGLAALEQVKTRHTRGKIVLKV